MDTLRPLLHSSENTRGICEINRFLPLDLSYEDQVVTLVYFLSLSLTAPIPAYRELKSFAQISTRRDVNRGAIRPRIC